MAEAKLSGPMKLLQEKLNERVLVHDTGSPQQQRLKVGALNANSIIDPARCGKVQASIKDNCFDIFAIIETKLHKDDHTGDQWKLDGYSYVRKDRRYKIKQTPRTKTKNTNEPTKPNPPGAPGGGILIYIHNAVRYKVKSRGEYAESNVEFLHIEITYPVKLHLVALYSPEKILVDHLISLMSYFMEPLGNRNIMFIGDTNINKYGGQQQDNLGNTFFDVLKWEYKVKQLIDKGTYISSSVQKPEHNIVTRTFKYSCIDHIFTNLTEGLERGVMKNSVAATYEWHEGIYCTVPASQQYWTLRNELSKKLWKIPQEDACILAIFCEFQQADEMLQAEHPWHRSVKDEESVYYMKFKDITELNNSVKSLPKFIDKIVSSEHLLMHNTQQWTIFTRNETSGAFSDLHLTMKNTPQTFTYECYAQKAVGNTTYDAQKGSRKAVREFMNQLVGLLTDVSANKCILAVFCQFPPGADAPNITPKEGGVLTYSHEIELACYIKVDDVDAVKDKIQSIEEYTKRVIHLAIHKQCIIFTRNSRSPVFHALQKEMWYKDWDFVWQPRHVEFLGYVLEPSLTYAYRDGKDPIWNKGQLSQEQAIALQECTYRYWSTNWQYIERMYVDAGALV